MEFYKNNILNRGLIIVLFLLKITNLVSQTDNYWSWNFNTPSTLLGGAVVGGAAGPSAIFYNPALIDHDNIATLSISANIISFKFFAVKNIAGNGIDVSNLILTIQPRFFSYVLPTKNKKLGLEMALVSPISEKVEFNIQHFDQLDIIKRMQGVETFSGYIDYSRISDDTWGGIGFSYKISDNFYIGGSAFGSYKSLKYKHIQSAQAYQEVDSVIVDQALQPAYYASSSFDENLSYWDFSFVLKFGIQYLTKNKRFSIGVNLTMPNIPVLGQANVRKAYQLSNVFDDSSGSFVANNIVVANDENAKTSIKSPFSAALGIQYFTNKKGNFVSLTVEYFQKIDPYPIFDTPDIPYNEIPDYIKGFGVNAFLPYYDQAKSVTNVAVGLKQTISPEIYIFGGFRTDFTSGAKDNYRFIGDKFKISQIQMDKYHISVGPVLKIKRTEVVTGFQYTFGRNKNLPQAVNYASPVEYIPDTGQALEGLRSSNAEASVNEISLFLGITFDLFKPKSAEEKAKQF